ncbi:MAG TPA: diacylglycerol kinase family lipid kinase [bacterium]|nr:diacylglycerol kinase family lipid kinase [bacterium]HQI47149.1 diacylglycerol kinase family lipid kinase [bacterium]HQJ63552.1 diacylglycerol kinase family lipid kinase [bacterium]
MQLKKVRLIYNPKSGLMHRPRLIRKGIEGVLAGAPFAYDFVETEYRGHAHELARQAAAEGYDAVVAIGGDGTVNEVGSALLYTGTALGIIPAGSGNGLARGLSIPVAVRRAARILLHGRIRTIDAGTIEDRIFFIVTGLGFDALVGKLFDDRTLRGPLPYFYIGIREFFFFRPETFRLEFDGRTVERSALLVTVANTPQWGLGAIIAPKAEPDDGLLDVCLIRNITWLRALIHLPKLFTGRIEEVREYERYQTTALRISRPKPGPFHVDGEPVDAGRSVEIGVKPQALKVIVPMRHRAPLPVRAISKARAWQKQLLQP